MKTIFILSVLTTIIFGFNGCSNTIESASSKKADTNESDSLSTEVVKIRNILLNEYKVSDPNESGEDYIQLIFDSSTDIGEVITFKQVANEYFLEIVTKHPKDSANRFTKSSIKMEDSDWEELESIVDEFDFWSAIPVKPKRRTVLDGYRFILEGSRLTNKGTLYNLVARPTPKYDKIGALCSYLMNYKEELLFEYNQIVE